MVCAPYWTGIVGLVLLLVQAVDTNASATAITSYSLYGGSMITSNSTSPTIPNTSPIPWLMLLATSSAREYP
jgi:hemolysin III